MIGLTDINVEVDGQNKVIDSDRRKNKNKVNVLSVLYHEDHLFIRLQLPHFFYSNKVPNIVIARDIEFLSSNMVI
jgi:hypothetical protein